MLNDKFNQQNETILKEDDSRVIKALSESVNKGRRKKFHIISYKDINEWANENTKNFEECVEYKQIIEKIEKLNVVITSSQQAQNNTIIDESILNNESSDIKNEENTVQLSSQDQEPSNEMQLEELTKLKLEYLSKFLKVRFVQLKLSDIEARIAEKEALAKKAAEEEQMNNLQPPGLLQQNQNQTQEEGKKKDKEKGKKGQSGKNGSQDKKQEKDSSTSAADPNGDKNQNKRRIKLRQRIVNIDPIPVAINDEPENGPEIYYLLYGFSNPQLFEYLLNFDIHVDALIRMEEIPKEFVSRPPEVHQSKSEIDISKKVENPLDLLESQSTSNRSKFSKLSLDDQSSLYSYNAIDDKSNYSTKPDQNKNIVVEEDVKNTENEIIKQQSLEIKISSVTWKNSLNSNIIKYKLKTNSNNLNSIWKDVVWCDIPFKQKDEPDIIFDQLALKIYEILEKKDIYNKFYDNTLVINIPECDKENNLKYYKYLSEVASYIEPSISIEIWLEILIHYALKTMNINGPSINIDNIDNNYPYFKILNIPWNKEPEKQEEINIKDIKETKEGKNKDKQLNIENQQKTQQNQSTLSINTFDNLSILNIQRRVNLNNENKEFLGYSSFDCYFDDIIHNISLINTEETVEKKAEDETNENDNMNMGKDVNYNNYQIVPKDNRYLKSKLLYEKLKIIGININEVYDTFLKYLVINRSLKCIHKEMNNHQPNILNDNQFHTNTKCPCNSNNRDILLRKTELFKSTNFPESTLNKTLLQWEFESLINMETNDITDNKKPIVLDEYCWIEKHNRETMIQIIEKYKSIYPEMIYKLSNFNNGTLLIMKSPGPTGCLISETFEKSQVKNKVNFGLFYEYYDNKREYLECPELKFIPKKNNDLNQDKKTSEDQLDNKKNGLSKKKGKKTNEKEKATVPEKNKNQGNKKGDKADKTDKTEKIEKGDKKKNSISTNTKKSPKIDASEPIEETSIIENEKMPTNYIYNTNNDIVLFNNKNSYIYPRDGNIIQVKTINSLTVDFTPQIYYNIFTPFGSLSYGNNKNDKYPNYLYINYNDDSTFSFKISKNGKLNIQYYTVDGILTQYYEDGRIKQKLTTYNKNNLKYQVSDKIELYRVIIPGGKILKVKSSQNYEVYYPNGNITYYDNNGTWTSINEKGKCVQTNSLNETKELPSLEVFYERLPIPNETKYIRNDMVVIRYTDGVNRIVEFPNGIKISTHINKKNEENNDTNNAFEDTSFDNSNNINKPPKIESFDSIVNIYQFDKHRLKVNNYDEEFKMNEILNYKNKNIEYKCESNGFPTTVCVDGGNEIHTIYKNCKIIQFMIINEDQKYICQKIRILKYGSCVDLYMDGNVCFIPYYKNDSSLISNSCSRYNIDIKSRELIVNDITGKEYKINKNRISTEFYGNNSKSTYIDLNTNETEKSLNLNDKKIDSSISKISDINESNKSLNKDINDETNKTDTICERFIDSYYKKISSYKLLKYCNSDDNKRETTPTNNKDLCGLYNISNSNNDIFSLNEATLNNKLIKNLMKNSFSEKFISNGNTPKLFFIHEDGTGIELLRDVDVFHSINEMDINIDKDIIEEPLADDSNGVSVTITKKLDSRNISFNINDSKIIIYKQLVRYPKLTLNNRNLILDELIYYNNWLKMHNAFIEDNDNVLESIYSKVSIGNNNDNDKNQNDKDDPNKNIIYGANKEETENAILEKYSELLLRNSMKPNNYVINDTLKKNNEVNTNEISETHKKRYKILKNVEASKKKERSVKEILKIDEEIKNSVNESSIFPKYFETIDPSKIPKENINKYKKKDYKKKERNNSYMVKLSNIKSSISIKKRKNDISENKNENSSLSTILFNNDSSNDSKSTEEFIKKESEELLDNTESQSSLEEIKYNTKPNINYQIIEAGTKRKLKTISTVNESKSLESLISKATLNSKTVSIKKLEKLYREKFKYLLNVDPKSCDFGNLQENTRNIMKVTVMNRTNDIIRFKIVQPKSDLINIKYKVGPISPGLQIKIIVEIIAPKTSNQFSIDDYGQIITENEIIKIPITATILPTKELDN
ncbi:hypothetical protein BCR36DRAFT_581541 [Piromyces finnis]|uniref:Uncharacterized protein n=1 Tax=Piromyces finnis TaxID=1754191 RepID=A0A1Y1VEW4_9FUNG|nr:hypothetical protein BCR36DRAFT_581541 [Piromyces finnis]|eukprot:ORX54656.1 hypothetical protein BCR36DRAFT_581541 [Piromyces finnis]